MFAWITRAKADRDMAAARSAYEQAMAEQHGVLGRIIVERDQAQAALAYMRGSRERWKQTARSAEADANKLATELARWKPQRGSGGKFLARERVA